MRSGQRLLLILLLGLPLRVGATGWLTGPSSYRQAVLAMAASRWQEAQTLIDAARPQEGRVDWVQNLLRERREAEVSSGYRLFELSGEVSRLRLTRAVGHCYAHHNLYLFLRREGVEESLLQDAFDRAEHVYRVWRRAYEEKIPDSIRWAYAALLYEGGRGSEVARLLEETRGEGTLPHGPEGPTAAEAGRFQLGFQMLQAYFHTARRDHPTALAYLEAAHRSGGATVLGWIRESDDFWALRDDPRFQRLLAPDREAR